MMAKIIKKIFKLNISAGTATPAPPIGPALGQHGVNIGQFISQFNEATKSQIGSILPTEITVYEDRTFEFKLKTPLSSDLLRKAAGAEKGSGVPNKQKVGKITDAQLAEIAQLKMVDLNADTLDAAKKILAGTARNMGIEIEG